MIAYMFVQISAGVVSSLFLKTFLEDNEGNEFQEVDLTFVQYIGFEIIAACLFVLASLYASKKEVDDFSGSIIVAGSAFVAIAASHNYTKNALNPAVTLPLNFINSDFKPTPKIILSTFLGAMLALFIYMILENEEVSK